MDLEAEAAAEPVAPAAQGVLPPGAADAAANSAAARPSAAEVPAPLAFTDQVPGCLLMPWLGSTADSDQMRFHACNTLPGSKFRL